MIYSYVILQAPGGGAMNFLFLGGMIAVFYFFIIRPQQKKQRRQREFSSNLKKGDNVVTMGGMHGKIASIEGDCIFLEIDRGIKVKFEKAHISFENSKTKSEK